MNDTEILKLAIKSTVRKMLDEAGLTVLNPFAGSWLDGAMNKGVFKALLYGYTNEEGNLDIHGLTKALEDTLKDFGGKLKGKFLGYTFAIVPEDIQKLPKEFETIKSSSIS